MKEHYEEKRQRDYFLPASIVLAALLIGAALVYNAGKTPDSERIVDDESSGNPLLSLSRVTSADHIIGEVDAPIKIVLFSDTECPFCKDFHFTVKRIAEEYSDRVALVYRHAPIDMLHSKSRKEAEATECAADLGGNEKFWDYLDRMMEITPSNDGLSESELPRIAEYVGLDVPRFNACLSSGKFADKVDEHLREAMRVGMQGTPYSVFVMRNVPQYALPGAVPYDDEVRGQTNMKMIIEELLKEI